MHHGSDAHPEPRVRGDGILRALEGLFHRLDRAIDRVVPAQLNPLTQTGAIANLSFVAACVTGVLVLIWYSASVHLAWSSVEEMGQAPLTAGLIRSLHRISSDAAMLFATIHGVKLLAARRFAGARWVAWVTGILLIGTLWLVGWLGYWLVWDTRAQSVAVGTARMLDGLPIFADPLSRSFLANETVNSLLFFVVFFFHMIVPLAMGVLLWLHITRLSRAKFFPGKAMSAWVLGSMVLLAIVHPATSAPAADLTGAVADSTIDFWYLLPLSLTDRLGGGALWALVLCGGAVLLSVPWALSRGRALVAQVDLAKCNGCTLCYQDCPYDAIRMVPRTDGRGYEVQAVVDEDKCVGCGICAGACDPGGIFLPQLPVVDRRKQLESWIEEEVAEGSTPHLAFVCASSAGGALSIDESSGTCAQLPGYRVHPVPCTGWVQRFTLERAIRRGAAGVLVIGCGPGEAPYREGAGFTELRIEGKRAPALRHDKVPAERVRFLRIDPTRPDELIREAARFRKSEAPIPRLHVPWRKVAGGAAIAASAALVVGAISDMPYSPPPAGTELVVSFKHPGKSGERCRDVTEEEKARLPAHMRQDRICERGRASVRLLVEVDGEKVLEKAYEPRGLSSDGNSVAIERLPLEPGERRISVAIGDSLDPAEWSHRDERTVRIEASSRQVVLFDRVAGWTWHGGGSAGLEAGL